MICGQTPFIDNNEYLMYDMIVNKPLEFVKEQPIIVKDFLMKILQKDPLKRFGV